MIQFYRGTYVGSGYSSLHGFYVYNIIILLAKKVSCITICLQSCPHGRPTMRHLVDLSLIDNN